MTADDIIARVGNARGVTVLQIKSPNRSATVVLTRHEAMWLIRFALNMSYPDLGTKFGGRDHSTAHAGVARIQRLVDARPEYGDELRARLRQIADEIRGAARATDSRRAAYMASEAGEQR